MAKKRFRDVKQGKAIPEPEIRKTKTPANNSADLKSSNSHPRNLIQNKTEENVLFQYFGLLYLDSSGFLILASTIS